MTVQLEDGTLEEREVAAIEHSDCQGMNTTFVFMPTRKIPKMSPNEIMEEVFGGPPLIVKVSK